MIYTDIRELKSLMEIPTNDLSQDKNILWYAQWASNLIDTFMGRDLTYKSRTQYYNGTGTQRLLLKNRPVVPSPGSGYSTLTVYTDGSGYYGTGSDAFSDNALTYGSDYTLEIDQDDGSSRCGILVRINKFWERPFYRTGGLLSPFQWTAIGNIKVVYTAGWTVDTLPPQFRMAADLLVTRIAYIFPLGMELSSESYEERNISMNTERKDYLLALIKPLLTPFRNWKW